MYSDGDRVAVFAGLARRLELESASPSVELCLSGLESLPAFVGRTFTYAERRGTDFHGSSEAAAETHWDGPDPTGRLRLVRAYPKSNTAAWLLVFDELGYDPDFIVADAGTGIVAAIDSFFGPRHTKLIPSMWHLNDRISRALNDTKGAHTVTRRGRELIAPLREHCYPLTGPATYSTTPTAGRRGGTNSNDCCAHTTSASTRIEHNDATMKPAWPQCSTTCASTRNCLCRPAASKH